jgi:hypothetical protein
MVLVLVNPGAMKAFNKTFKKQGQKVDKAVMRL